MNTRKVGIREVRQRLRSLLAQVQAGDEIIVLRRGVEAARLIPPKQKSVPLPDLTEFRASVKVKGGAMSREVIDNRRRSRY
jgi:prevent-host-death family protein